MNKELFWLKIYGMKKQSEYIDDSAAGRASAGMWSNDDATPMTRRRRALTDRAINVGRDAIELLPIVPAYNMASGAASRAWNAVSSPANNLVVQPVISGRSDDTTLGWISNSLEDIGESIGGSLGDAAAKLNDKPTKYHGTYAGVVDLLNEKEQAALYRREAKRLLRRARIEYRKRLLKEKLADKAVRSPFI